MSIAAKAILLRVMPALEGEPLLAFPYAGRASAATLASHAIIYGVFAPVQEFVARGALQGSLQQFLTGPHVKARAVVIATILFATTHLHISVVFALRSIVPGLLWGTLFARQGTLLGASVSHALIGWWMLFVLGLPGLT